MAAWMPLYWGDYIRKTLHLSLEEHGAYLLLIAAYWERGKALPDDDRYFAKVLKMSTKKWKMVRPIIAEFFDVSEGCWKHERVELELLRSSNRQAAAIANGRAGGLAKSYLSTPTSTKEQESKKEEISNFVIGKKRAGNGSVTILDSTERLSRFQKTLAEKPGNLGWEVVTHAADPQHPNYWAAIHICRDRAKELGKGWPRQWPA